MASPCSPHLSIFIVKCNKTLCVPSHSPLQSSQGCPCPAQPHFTGIWNRLQEACCGCPSSFSLQLWVHWAAPTPRYASMLFWEVLMGLLFSILNVLCRPQPFWRMATCSRPRLEAPL